MKLQNKARLSFCGGTKENVANLRNTAFKKQNRFQGYSMKNNFSVLSIPAGCFDASKHTKLCLVETTLQRSFY